MVEFSDFLHTFFKANNKAATGIIMMGTIHWSKGLEADDVYIVQPATLPLPERIALGGWQKYEELCIQARTPYFYLPNTRPFTPCSLSPTRGPPTQETMAAESEDDEEDQSRAEEAVFAALDLLGLQAVHGSHANSTRAHGRLRRALAPSNPCQGAQAEVGRSMMRE